MKKYMSLSLVIAAILANQAFAGTAQGEVDCVSASGRTRVQAIFPGDSPESAFKVTVDGKSLTFVNRQMRELIELNSGRIYTDFSPGALSAIQGNDRATRGRFSLSARADGSASVNETLQSVGGTFRIQKARAGTFGSFEATLQGEDPRQEGAKLPLITLSCKYEYAL